MFRHIDTALRFATFCYCNETIDMSKYTFYHTSHFLQKYEESSEKLKSMTFRQVSPYQHCSCIEAKTATIPILVLAYGTQKR